MNAALLEDCARERTNSPPDWRAFRFAAMPLAYTATHYYEVTGAVTPLKKNNQPDWRKRDRATERTAYITPAEYRQFVMEWEKKTGQCADCRGVGQTVWRWSVANGTEYKTCPRCAGSGRAQPQKEMELL